MELFVFSVITDSRTDGGGNSNKFQDYSDMIVTFSEPSRTQHESRVRHSVNLS